MSTQNSNLLIKIIVITLIVLPIIIGWIVAKDSQRRLENLTDGNQHPSPKTLKYLILHGYFLAITIPSALIIEFITSFLDPLNLFNRFINNISFNFLLIFFMIFLGFIAFYISRLFQRATDYFLKRITHTAEEGPYTRENTLGPHFEFMSYLFEYMTRSIFVMADFIIILTLAINIIILFIEIISF